MEHELELTINDENDNEKKVIVFVEFEVTPISRGSYFSSNGDPGYPDEGGEVEIISIVDYDGNEYEEDVLTETQKDTLYRIGIEE